MPEPDENGEECIIVIKNGNTISVTFAIYLHSQKDGAFSAPGNSGSIITNTKSCIVGMIASSASQMGSIDITYALPYY
ncbi:uncharacterized protein PHACADRAFT_202926 [Phanerochaete carnosa HHB-10118-sp]|uniref:Uncharacterized protein n=1 Tax=Phanerochaete carnosa (strain HHB-10118-sp) TaxID=650164 RepID=K5VP73_PHACS|nr:uncharacterized protein PHACADRAFT_202926 [Phanerochaete carnosa HHB-10118-sp]EKM48354.1 hypothetical protein PHACADRAFT_202926 [Phanerochaete carnosa HHB-10118-sp]